MIKAVIFDFDGLIIDTETPWYRAYREVLGQHGIELPLDVWGRCIGTSFKIFNPIDYMIDRSGQILDRNHIYAEAKKLYSQLMEDQGLRPGVLSYLSRAKELGLAVGLASSSRLSWIENYLEKFRIRKVFDTIVTADRVSRVKPEPELYRTAMEDLQVSGREAVSFEDSLNGLTAAKAAGLYCVIVPNEVTSYLDFQQHDLRLASMAEMDLQAVIERIRMAAC